MSNTDKLPLFPLHAVLFPQMTLPLHIFEERYRTMVARCLERKEPFGVVLIRNGAEVERGDAYRPVIHGFGTIARIDRADKLADGRYDIVVHGESRIEIKEIYEDLPYLTGNVRIVWDSDDDPLTMQPVFDQACALFREYIALLMAATDRQIGAVQLPGDPALLSYAIGASLQTTLAEKQKLLELPSAYDRLQRELEIMKSEREARRFMTADSAPRRSDADTRPDRLAADHARNAQAAGRTILRVDPSYAQYFFSRN